MKRKRIKTYAKGRRYEYRLKEELEKRGYLVIRSAGSHSPFDLIAIPINSEEPIEAIQVKTGKLSYSQTLEILKKMPKIGSRDVHIIRKVIGVEKGKMKVFGMVSWRGNGYIWCEKRKGYSFVLIN